MIGFLDIRYFWFSLLVPVIILMNIRLLRRKTIISPSLIVWKQILKRRSGSAVSAWLKKIARIALKCILAVLCVCILAGMYTDRDNRPERVFVLDNTATMSAVCENGTVPYDAACAYIQEHAEAGDSFYIISPRIRRISLQKLPDRASWCERPAEEALRGIISRNRDSSICIVTDRAAPEGYRPSVPVEWHAVGGPCQTVGLLSACTHEKGCYITLRNTYVHKKRVLIDVWNSGRIVRKKEVEVKPGTDEVFIASDEDMQGFTETAVVLKDDGWKADNYYCTVPHMKRRKKVYISGDPLPRSIVSFLKAYSAVTVSVPSPRAHEVNVVRGSLPEQIPEGKYLLIEPEGRISRCSFSKRSNPSAGPVSIVEEPDAALISRHTEFSSGAHVRVTHMCRGENRVRVLTAGGVPAAGYTRTGEYRAVYLLFSLQETAIPGTPAFPVLMKNIMDFLFGMETGYYSRNIGDPVTVPEAGMKVTRRGETAETILHSGANKHYLEEPGIYTVDSTPRFAVNPCLGAAVPAGEKGRFRYGTPSAFSEEQRHGLFPVLWIAAAVCISILGFLERS